MYKEEIKQWVRNQIESSVKMQGKYNNKTKAIWLFPKILDYLKENYSKNNSERNEILEEVINEYKGYMVYW